MDPELITSCRDRSWTRQLEHVLFGRAEIVEYRHSGAKGKDKMPETDEICDLRLAKSLLPLWAPILPRQPPPIPPGQSDYTTYDGNGSL